MKKVCFFHRADHDGKCAGQIVYNHYHNPPKMIGINYGDDYEKTVFDNVDEDTLVIMVDFCLQPWDQMIRLLNSCNHLIWIDHHAEAIKAYERWAEWPNKKIDGMQVIGQAGCELTWRYFNQGADMPRAVYLIGRYDVWEWQDVPDALQFQMGLRLEETWPGKEDSAYLWECLLSDDDTELENIVEQGRTVLRYKSQQDAIHVKAAAFNLRWRGKVWVAINEMFNNSQLFDTVYDPKQHHGMLTFGWRRDQWNVSLYTTRDDVNVGEIATAVGKELGTGGGGHQKAAGFQAKELPFSLLRDKIHWFKG